jgi:pentafunctional AROM polypeptide
MDARDAAASVVLIGMRGSGKTFIGERAALALGWSCVDADTYFEDYHGRGVREFVHEHGWPAFRSAETKILQDLLTNKAKHHVISLGGGIVESPAARELLKNYGAEKGPVVHIQRHIDEVIQYLGVENARPAYGEPVIDVFWRREPWFVECSTYEFINNTGELTSGSDLPLGNSRPSRATLGEISRFFKHITGLQPNLARNLEPNSRSYFLSLTYPDVTPALLHIEDLTTGVDAIELRVDLLRAPQDFDVFKPYIPKASYVADQITALRRVTSLPIVFTVRTVSQGGLFPDHQEKEAFAIFALALRLGVEYIDVEISWSEKSIRNLISRKGFSKIIASWHDWSGMMKWDGSIVKEKYEIASRFGDIIKIIGKANSIQDNFTLFEFASRMRKGPQAKPVIAINMGGEGQMSRILNPSFTPVSHPLLPTKAAPGQLSFRQIQSALHLLGQLPARRFFLFGKPISQSMSPTLHNTAFDILGLPHHYELLETEDVGEEIKATVVSPDFGGASVTIPFKLDVMPLLDKLSAAAKAIGAVNTIIPMAANADGSGQILFGDNTDWLGIRDTIRSRLPSSGKAGPALVIGAGGTARAALYALHALGVQCIYLHNRTPSKAQALANDFPEVNVQLVGTLDSWSAEKPSPSIIVSTVPASAITTNDGNADAVFLPRTLFSGNFASEEGIVLDMAYKPAETPLLALAKSAGKNWITVPGLEVLLEQGYVQFELWTGRKCPRSSVERSVWDRYAAPA